MINEYLDVADAFYDQREKGFVNGLLDAIAKVAPGPPSTGASSGTGLIAGSISRRDEHRRARLHRPAAAARHRPAARGLDDDAAVIGDLVLTHDMIAEGVHFLSTDPPASVGWKLVAVNLSDLAAKGAEPVAALMGMTLGGDSDWEERFLGGVAAACETYGWRWLAATPSPCPKALRECLG